MNDKIANIKAISFITKRTPLIDQKGKFNFSNASARWLIACFRLGSSFHVSGRSSMNIGSYPKLLFLREASIGRRLLCL